MPYIHRFCLLILAGFLWNCDHRHSTQRDDLNQVVQVEEVADLNAADTDFCVYKVFEITKGDCPELTPNTTMCVRCPNNRTCPGPAGGKSRFALVKNGRVACEGTWIRRAIPDACSDCPDGTDERYVFK